MKDKKESTRKEKLFEWTQFIANLATIIALTIAVLAYLKM